MIVTMTLEPPLVCVDPGAPVVACVVCGTPVHTCERAEPVQIIGSINDYRCPMHPDGSEVGKDQAGRGRWTCSSRCFETWSLVGEFERMVTESSIDAADRDRVLQQAAEWREDAPELVVPPARPYTMDEIRDAAGYDRRPPRGR